MPKKELPSLDQLQDLILYKRDTPLRPVVKVTPTTTEEPVPAKSPAPETSKDVKDPPRSPVNISPTPPQVSREIPKPEPVQAPVNPPAPVSFIWTDKW